MSTKIVTKTPKKNKSFAFRMSASSNLEFLLNYLENRYIGLDKTEIVKLALTELYQQSKQKEMSNFDILPSSDPFASDEDFSKWWNSNKNDVRS